MKSILSLQPEHQKNRLNGGLEKAFFERQKQTGSEGFACISGNAADIGLPQCLHWGRKAPPGLSIMIRIHRWSTKKSALTAVFL